jgi:cell division septum initiation protein DivIVA
MSLFPNQAGKSLVDVLGQQAQNASASTADAYTQGRKKLVSQQAASGRLMSGVSDYPLVDLDTEGAKAQSGIQNSLASSLSQIPSEDWLNQQEYGQNQYLTDQISNSLRPTALQEIFKGLGTAGKVGGTYAAYKGY